MKKYVITWYESSYLGEVGNILNEKEIEVSDDFDIMAVGYTSVLPEEIVDKIPYIRIIFYGPGEIHIDYGSHTKFISVKETKNEK